MSKKTNNLNHTNNKINYARLGAIVWVTTLFVFFAIVELKLFAFATLLSLDVIIGILAFPFAIVHGFRWLAKTRKKEEKILSIEIKNVNEPPTKKHSVIPTILLAIGIFIIGWMLGSTTQRSTDMAAQKEEVTRVQANDSASCKQTLDKTVSDCNNKIKQAANSRQPSTFATSGSICLPAFGLGGGMVVCY